MWAPLHWMGPPAGSGLEPAFDNYTSGIANCLVDRLSSDWHGSPGISRQVGSVGHAAREMHPAALAEMALGQRGCGLALDQGQSPVSEQRPHPCHTHSCSLIRVLSGPSFKGGPHLHVN